MRKKSISKALLTIFLVCSVIVILDGPGNTTMVIRMPQSNLDGFGQSQLPPPIDDSGVATPPRPTPSPRACLNGSWAFTVSYTGPYNYPDSPRTFPGTSDKPPYFATGEIDSSTGLNVWNLKAGDLIIYGTWTNGLNTPAMSAPPVFTCAIQPQPNNSPVPTGDNAVGGGSPSPSPSSPAGDGSGSGGSGSGGSGASGDKSKPKNGEDEKGYKSTKPNFIAYGMRTLSKKFPFDVFGTPSEDGDSDVCPKLEILDKKFELCIILDALKILKIPTIIAFIIWSIQSL